MSSLEPSRAAQDAARAFAHLVSIVERLRAPDGCPWDREQTHASLRIHLVEEAAEVLEAIELEAPAALREELGDLMLQPVLHAQIASEANEFTMAQVLDEICEKLVRRHPHVFGTAQAHNAADVTVHWDAIKRQEKASRGETDPSVLADLPPELPALAAALKVSKKAAKTGFEWPNFDGVLEKLQEEMTELGTAIEVETPARAAEELGDVLFTLVNVARWHKINPELALRDSVHRFRTRFTHMEAAARTQGRELQSLNPAEWNQLWEAAKGAS